MKKTTSFLSAAGILALGLSATASTAQALEEGFEKCYGIVKAGKNDCGAADGSHACSAQATKDGDPNEFLAVPEGTCDKIVGGSTTPPQAADESAPEEHDEGHAEDAHGDEQH